MENAGYQPGLNGQNEMSGSGARRLLDLPVQFKDETKYDLSLALEYGSAQTREQRFAFFRPELDALAVKLREAPSNEDYFKVRHDFCKLLGELRAHGMIPDRQWVEYGKLVAPNKNSASRLNRTSQLEQSSSN